MGKDIAAEWKSGKEDVGLCVQESVCIAAGSGQLTPIADSDLFDELGWAEPCTAAVGVCVSIRRGKERGRDM